MQLKCTEESKMTIVDMAAKYQALDRELKYLSNKVKTWRPKAPKKDDEKKEKKKKKKEATEEDGEAAQEAEETGACCRCQLHVITFELS